jgi:Na+/proline symporter
MCVSVMGAISGPMVGIFVLAIFWPRAGAKSTFVSFVLSNLVMCTICYTNYVSDPYRELAFPTNSTNQYDMQPDLKSILVTPFSSSDSCPYHGVASSAPLDYDAYYGDPNASFIAR